MQKFLPIVYKDEVITAILRMEFDLHERKILLILICVRCISIFTPSHNLVPEGHCL